ncbi:MAG: hypothetical protein U0V48_09760 [Anaerolineales bacterium]
MTLAIMQDFGVEVQRDGYQSFTIPLSTYQLPTPQFSTLKFLQSPVSNLQPPIPNYQLPITNYPIEMDASAASSTFSPRRQFICGTVKVEKHLSKFQASCQIS